MVDIKIEFYDYSHVKIISSMSIIKELKDHFSFFVDGYKYSPKYLYTNWDGKISLMQLDGFLPYGLIPHLLKYAQDNNYTFELNQELSHKTEISRDEFDSWINSKKYYSGGEEIFPYVYQTNAVYESLLNKRKILNLPTSAGKSLIQALLTKFTLENSDRSVLILVPTVGLVDQMKDDFIDYGLFTKDEIAELKAGSKQGKQRVVVSTWQSAIKKPKSWFDKFGMLLCDEMHLAVGKSITAIINKLSFCEYKIGLSGSLRDGKANLMQYIGLFGSIFNPVKTSDLMESGQISKLKINMIFLKYPEKVCNASLDYKSEIKLITSLQKRTDWISKLSVNLANRNENVFVMFKHIEHGKKIYESVKGCGHKKVFYVSGEITPEQRNLIKKMAEEESGVIIIASYGVFSTGISVKNLHHVIFAHGIKSKVVVLQTIGRVLRKHKSKSLAQIWDIADDMSIEYDHNGQKYRKNKNYLLTHALDRESRYKTEGFNYIKKDVYFLKYKKRTSIEVLFL